MGAVIQPVASMTGLKNIWLSTPYLNSYSTLPLKLKWAAKYVSLQVTGYVQLNPYFYSTAKSQQPRAIQYPL